MLSSRTAMLVLGCFILLFVALNVMRVTLRVPAGWEPWLSPPAGLLAGVIGGVPQLARTPPGIFFFPPRLAGGGLGQKRPGVGGPPGGGHRPGGGGGAASPGAG